MYLASRVPLSVRFSAPFSTTGAMYPQTLAYCVEPIA